MGQGLKDVRIADIEGLEELLPYLMYRVSMYGGPATELSPAQMQADQPTWHMEGMVDGLEHLADLARGADLLLDVYGPRDCCDDPEKAQIKLIRMPAAESDPAKPFVICVAGGAYGCVCSLVESIPVATRLNALGYDCYVFNYRCGRSPLLPLPLDDLAAAVRRAQVHRAAADLPTDSYVVCGFSAGGNLTAMWGTNRIGWAHYSLPAPKALMLAYPFVSYGAMPEGSEKDWFCGLTVGTSTADATEPYDVALNLTDAYPPCYITAAEDDPVVPVLHSKLLQDKLSHAGAVCIRGPKWCGKTSTALQRAKSALFLQDPDTRANNLRLAAENPRCCSGASSRGCSTSGRMRRSSGTPCALRWTVPGSRGSTCSRGRLRLGRTRCTPGRGGSASSTCAPCRSPSRETRPGRS